MLAPNLFLLDDIQVMKWTDKSTQINKDGMHRRQRFEESSEIISSRGRSLCLRSCQAASVRSDADCTYASGM